MKKYIYILFIAVLCSMASCTVPFDPDFNENPMIFVEGFPGADAEYVKIKVMPAYSRSNTPVMIPFKPVITFKVNGTEIPVKCIDADGGYYKALHASKPGDKMSISVESEGFQSVYSETSIPEAFPKRKIDYRKVPSGVDTYEDVLFVTISDVNPKYSYGLQICNEVHEYYASETVERTFRYCGYLYPRDAQLDEMVPITLEATCIRLYGEDLWSWNGNTLADGENTFTFMPAGYGYGGMDSYDAFFVQEGTSTRYDEHGNIIEEYQYLDRNKLLLYTISDEFYKYSIAQEFQGDNDGILSIIAPTNFCYSNIDNGYGAFAGIYIVETDWITKEFIENNR